MCGRRTGRLFDVTLDDGKMISVLQEAIKQNNPKTVKCDAKDLQLFLAKAANGAWLDGAGVAAVTVDEAGAVPVMLDEDGNRHDFVKMDPLLWIKNDQHFGEKFRPDEDEVHVLVVVPHPQRAASTKKQQRYKRISTEASCCKFLDALAQKLFCLYDFRCRFSGTPTIDDVFRAINKNKWGFRMMSGEQLTSVRLPDLFTEEELGKLMELNLRINLRMHDGNVATTTRGKLYLILPQTMFTGDRVDFYKGIAKKVGVLRDLAQFEVKDEGEFSGSSRSRSGRSAGA